MLLYLRLLLCASFCTALVPSAFSEREKLELELCSATLSSIRSRIRRLKALEAGLRPLSSDGMDDEVSRLHTRDCLDDPRIKDIFGFRLRVWENYSQSEWALDALRAFASTHTSQCLSSLFVSYTSDLLRDEVIVSQIRSGMDLSSSLKLKRHMAETDASVLRQDVSRLNESRSLFSFQLQRYMIHFVHVINYLRSFSHGEIERSPLDPLTASIIQSIRARLEPILAEIPNIVKLDPYWFGAAVYKFSIQFHKFRSETDVLLHSYPQIPRRLVWDLVIKPLMYQYKIVPESRHAEIRDVSVRIGVATRLSEAVTVYILSVSSALIQVDELLSEIVSFGFDPTLNPTTQSTADDLEFPHHIVAGITRLVESDD